MFTSDGHNSILSFFFLFSIFLTSLLSHCSCPLSLRMYHKKLLLGEIISRSDLSAADTDIVSCWSSDPDVVSSVWTLVDLCSSSPVATEASPVVADFISRVGFWSFVLFHAAVCC